MALTGKTINELPEITGITPDTEFVVEQSGTTYKVKAGNIHTGNLFGSFISTNNQSITGTTQESYVMIVDETIYSQGVSVVDGSKFTVASGGTFNLQFSAQLDRTSGDTGSTITIWIRKNGVDVESSAGEIFAGPGAFVAKQLPSWNFVETMNAGDYLELVWAANNPYVILRSYLPKLSPPIAPGTPSIAVTITQI